MTNTITINVVGSANTGKSTIAYLLADVLSHIGFEDVNLNLLDDIQVEKFEEHFEERLQTLQDKGLQLVVNEVQAPRVWVND